MDSFGNILLLKPTPAAHVAAKSGSGGEKVRKGALLGCSDIDGRKRSRCVTDGRTKASFGHGCTGNRWAHRNVSDTSYFRTRVRYQYRSKYYAHVIPVSRRYYSIFIY
jgi:hypothetical protein